MEIKKSVLLEKLPKFPTIYNHFAKLHTYILLAELKNSKKTRDDKNKKTFFRRHEDF